MTCDHPDTTVYDSRRRGHEDARVTDFDYVRVRRHRCYECGDRFATFELTEAQLDELVRLRLEGLRAAVRTALGAA